ncbi:MAG TPA: peptidylprolyl isomerase, partial [Microthrixaceae bacterium]|nr:peptidylprolyl isomerase [Microthrixaceae bacterium]
MGTSAEKHARQKQARSSKLQEATVRARQSSRRRRLVTVIGVLLGVGIIVAGVWILTGSGDDDTAEGSTTTTTAGDSTTTTAADAAELPRPPEGITLTEKTPCPPAAGTEKRVERFAGPPPTCIDHDASYTATFSTTKGDFTVECTRSWAPNGVDRFYNLVKIGFFDDIAFFRVAKGFVVQWGDPQTRDMTKK